MRFSDFFGMARVYLKKHKSFEFYWNLAGFTCILAVAGSLVLNNDFYDNVISRKKAKELIEKSEGS